MNTKRTFWKVFAVMLILFLFYCGFTFYHPVRTKTRAQRVQAVNRISEFSFTITNAAVSNSAAFPTRGTN